MKIICTTLDEDKIPFTYTVCEKVSIHYGQKITYILNKDRPGNITYRLVEDNYNNFNLSNVT